MKSILIGDPAMCKHAFPASVRAQLGAWTQLPDVPVTREEILAQPDLYRDTELIFSTWDMPHFTREELQECFPALRAVFYAAGSVQHFAREFLAAGAHVFFRLGGKRHSCCRVCRSADSACKQGISLCRARQSVA